MGLLTQFDPPAFLSDFNGIPGQLDAWHRAVSRWFDQFIGEDRPVSHAKPFPFYNPARFDPGGVVIDQAISWNAFPKELLRQFGRERALREADTLWTLDRYWTDLENRPISRSKYPELFKTYFRPQDEYCEWHVTRDPATNDIVRVTLVSEPPEYWTALAGGTVPGDTPGEDAKFPGDRTRLLQLYRELTGQNVRMDDLFATVTIDAPGGPLVTKGSYNLYNRWNSALGIVHLQAPPNALTAEIKLGVDGTVVRRDGRGRLLVEPDALICCSAYGGPDRNSDPTIGASVNALVRLGAYVTLPNPVGLYMDHIDLSGWEAPNGDDVSECVRIVRGTEHMIERLVVEVPAARGYNVSALTIGGEPIRYGGQIAECVTVKLIGRANLTTQRLSAEPVMCEARCCLDPGHATALHRPVRSADNLPVGTVEAYADQGSAESDLQSSTPVARTAKKRGKRASHALRGRVSPPGVWDHE
jgi:hypothetical protein